MNKSLFESRVSFNPVTKRFGRKVYKTVEASIYWNGALYETIKATKELCIADLMRKANYKND